MLKKDNYNEVASKIKEVAEKDSIAQTRILIAVDGRSASGKTTLAAYLKENLPCEIIHMDDFFLPVKQRRKDWMEVPGGNMDLDRFLREVLIPLQENGVCQVRPFNCRRQSYDEPYLLGEKKIVLVEGAYSCHPKLWDYFNLHIFVDVEPEVQKERIQIRNGEEGLQNFQKIWIPLEENYISTFKIKEKCELHF